jgi:hypothetical protein
MPVCLSGVANNGKCVAASVSTTSLRLLAITPYNTNPWTPWGADCGKDSQVVSWVDACLTPFDVGC